MRTIQCIKLLTVFAVAFSLASVTGALSGGPFLPAVQLGHAQSQLCQTHGSSGACSELWYPAGPAMNTLVNNIFTDEGAEYLNLQSTTPSIDLTDWECAGTPTSGTCGTICAPGNAGFLCTAPVDSVGYFEIEFMLDNQYWNCGFGFGNAHCGIEVRQGIAHMFDKNSYCANSVVAGTCTPIDNPLPTTSIGGLQQPNPCNYDASFPQAGTSCKVGAPGGTAYHLGASAGADGIAWLQAPGSADLNAAAQHFVNAGVATGFSSTTSILTGVNPGATGYTTPTFFIRNDNTPRRTLGESLAAQICYMFTGSYTQPCVPFFNTVEGPITAFPGFTTTPTSVNQDWWMYTAAFSGPTFVDGLYFGYNSHFVSASCLSPGTASCTTQQIGGGFCSNASVGTASAANYEYACHQGFDALSFQMETAPCLTAPGDPIPGQTVATLVTCPGTVNPTFAVTTGSAVTITQGSNTNVPISVTSLYGFSGTVSLGATVSPAGPTVTLGTNSVTLTPGTLQTGNTTTLLTIHTVASTPTGAYTVTVTGTSGSTSSTTTASVQVELSSFVCDNSSGVAISCTSVTGTGFDYTLQGAPADPHYTAKNNVGNPVSGFLAYTPVNANTTALNSPSVSCPGGLSLLVPAGCTTGNGGGYGFTWTPLVPGGISSTQYVCQGSNAGGCSVTFNGITHTMNLNSAFLLAGVAPANAPGCLPAAAVNRCNPSLDPTFVARTGTSTALSAGLLAEDAFGAAALTIPNFELTIQFGYLNNGWIRADNAVVTQLPNYFTWLNAWNSAPVQSGTIRQGWKETTRSTSPFIASTVWDFYIDGQVYDSLFAANPLSPGQLVDWMTYSAIQQNNATVISSSGYTPPPHTLSTYHFTLRNDLFFQDGTPVTAYDVAFSYLSLIGSGAFQASGASLMTGITVLGPRSFDIGVSSIGPFTLPDITGITILPGGYWTGAGSSSWTSAVNACTGATFCGKSQYALNGATVICPSASGQPGCPAGTPQPSVLQVDANKITATYDPVGSGTLVGSGPWACISSTGVLGKGCSTTGIQNPPAGSSYTLTRFGCSTVGTPLCQPPPGSTSGSYFRSSGHLALYDWTGESDTSAVQPVSAVSLCFNAPVPTGSCTHWQLGIGASANGVVGINQVSTVELRYNLNWVAPFEWATNPPLGIGSVTPVLYEGPVTLNPCSMQPTTGYDC